MIKHLLSMDQLSATDITTVLDTAESLRQVTDRPIKKLPTLRGRTVCNLFYEPSTRTRISFELAAKRLSADVINFSADSKSSVAKGESFKDTAWTLEAMGVDAIVVRHSSSGAPHHCSTFSRYVSTSRISSRYTLRSWATSSTRAWRARTSRGW
jgi:aspartate carbamoyltransferase catalytic subunit